MTTIMWMNLYYCSIIVLVLSSTVTKAATNSLAMTKTWSNRLGAVLTPISTGVWAAERPFLWNGIDVGGRSVIVRMADGGLLVHSPVGWTPALQAALDRLGGAVRCVVSPNFEHLRYAQQYADQFPAAAMYGCVGLRDRLPQIAWAAEIGRETPPELAESVATLSLDCEVNPFTGRPFFNEVLLLHRQSRTLICSDAYWNYPSGPLPNYFGVSGTGTTHDCSKVELEDRTVAEVEVPLGTRLWKLGMDRVYLPFYRAFMVGGDPARRARYDEVVRTVLEDWQPEVIAPCHGDVIRGKEICRRVLQEHFAI